MKSFTNFFYDDSLKPAFILETDGTQEKITLEKGMQAFFPMGVETHCLQCGKQTVSSSECYECKAKNAFGICLGCEGKKCLQYDGFLKKKCFENDYCVYLALFGKTIKAGVSLEKRLEKRLFEQGADLGVKIFRGFNGMKAREIEQSLFAEGYADSVRQSLPKCPYRLQSIYFRARICKLCPYECRYFRIQPE